MMNGRDRLFCTLVEPLGEKQATKKENSIF
jgi:hypothetical protein